MQNLNVLVVEDDEDDFFLLKHFIQYSEQWKIEFTLADNFDKGLEAYNNNHFDLCFLDHYLGVQTGIDFLNAIQQHKKSIPIILLTGLDNPAIDNLAIESGAADYIPKSSMSQEILERSIRHSLERHKQNELLKREKEKYRKLFKSSQQAVFLADENFKVAEANQAFKQLLKLDDLEDLSLATFFKRKKDFDQLTNFHETNASISLNQLKFKDKLGNSLIVNVSVAVVELADSENGFCYQGILQDITELEEAQLRSLAEQKFNLTGRMARIIGHEVRNPLTNIILAMGELEEDNQNLSEDDLEMYDMIKRSAKRIETLTDELLNSTKMLEVKLRQIPIEHVIEKSLSACDDRIQLMKIEVKTCDLSKKTLLFLDEDKFEIALTNIIINATEAMTEAKSGKLEISIEEESRAVTIAIRDNGKGMSKATIEKIYDPFFSERNGGLGLGMTNVKNVIIQHNALLTVESKLNEGSVFKIKIPKELKKKTEGF